MAEDNEEMDVDAGEEEEAVDPSDPKAKKERKRFEVKKVFLNRQSHSNLVECCRAMGVGLVS